MQNADMLIDHWRALPKLKGERLPRRSSLSISAVAAILPFCWQMSWHDGEDFTIKFMGERLIETWGRDMSGLELFKALPKADGTLLNDMVRPLFAQPCGLMVTRHLNKGEGGRYEFTNWSLPMLDASGDGTVVFGLSRFISLVAEAPYSGKLTFVGGTVQEIRFLDLGYGTPELDLMPAEAHPARA